MISRDGARWRVRIYYKARYVESRTFPRKRDALLWEAERKRLLAMGHVGRAALADKPISHFVGEWLAARPPRAANTKRKVEHLAKTEIVARIGRLPLSQLIATVSKKWAADVARDTSVWQARSSLVILRMIVKDAIADGVLLTDPTAAVRLGRMPQSEPKPLSSAELVALSRVVTSRDRALLLVLGLSGLRFSEAVALTWADLRGRELRVNKAFVEAEGQVGPTKTRANRSVAIPALAYVALLQWSETTRNRRDVDLIFGSAKNTHLRNRNWRRDVLTPAAERAGLGRTVTPHELRDTAATLAFAGGATVKVVQTMLGHDDAATTMRHYAGVLPSDTTAATRGLNEAMASALSDDTDEKPTDDTDDDGVD